MTAGDGYPPHADDSVSTDDQVPPVRKAPAVPGPAIPSWPKEWTVSPPGQPPAPFPDTAPLDTASLDAAALDTGPVDTSPADTAPLDVAAADAWQPAPPPDAYDPQPEAGSWFKPLDSDPDGPGDGPAAPPAGLAPGSRSWDVAPPVPALRSPSQDVPPPIPALRSPSQDVPPPVPALRSPSWEVAPPVPALRLPGPAVRPPRSAARRPRAAGRRRWIVPLAGGVAVVLVIAVVVLATMARHPSPGGSSAGTAGPSVSAGKMPSVMVPDALLRDLTRDLQSHNEAAFLSLVAAGARPSVRLWWENQQAIGFTSGVVLPMAANGQVSVDNKGDATTTFLAGTHNPLDAVDSNGKPDIPCERYRIGLHFASPAATGQITSWTPLDDDPWDQGTRLYVRKAANVVVAGLPADRHFVNEALPMAETAARYDIGLLNHGSRHDLHQKGFVVFVSAGAAAGWTVPQPQGWPLEYRHGRTVALPGPGVSGDSSALAGNVSRAVTGGARVVVTPYEQDQGTVSGETQDLVSEFMLDVLAPANGGQVQPVPSWALQGIGIMVQDLYAGNPNPAPKTYNFTPLMTALRKLPRSYRSGRLPTSADLFSGSLTAQEGWNDVAASVYAYIGTTYGVDRMLAAAVLLNVHRNTPLANVVAASTKGHSSYYPSGTVQARWRAALARI